MSKRKSASIASAPKAPKIQAAAPASTLPTTTGKKRGRPAKALQAAPQAATAQGNGTTPHTLPAAAAAPTGVLLRVGDDTTLSRTLAALKAHETRCKKAAAETKDKGEKEKLEGQAAKFAERISEIRAVVAALPAPAAAPGSAEPADAKTVEKEVAKS